MSDDQRKHLRQEVAEIIFIEVLSASKDDAEDSVLIECSTQDISMSGLKIQSAFPFIVGSVLELLIRFETGGYKFLLTGEVKWLEAVTEEGAESEYIAGFQLIDSEHSDYSLWVNMFNESPTTENNNQLV